MSWILHDSWSLSLPIMLRTLHPSVFTFSPQTQLNLLLEWNAHNLTIFLLSITGGDDHLVKVWDYNEGEVTFVGVGHSGSITNLKVCPNRKYIVSVSADGAILRWKYPHVH